MKDDSYVAYVLDQLSELPDIRSRRMFGGWGLYAGKSFFGIVSDDQVYFKTTEKTREKYKKHGSDCFRPSKEQVLKNYYEVPGDILEDAHTLSEWAEEASNV